jgi:enoyl-CoA hydratase
MSTDELITRRDGAAGFLTLNRPKAIHALTQAMDHAMTEALLAWRDEPEVKAVIIDHSEGRGFCAGGDVTLIRQSALTDEGAAGRRFFYEEYQLNHLLFTYPKPVVAFMDGITMGGGVGISQPAKYRVATEHTRFAMPETGIGLFPDVGGGWYLSRLPGRLGQFLALTGARLDGAECLWTGLATHYLPADRLTEAKERIAHGHEVAGVLGALSVSPPEPRIEANARAIARHFASDRFEDILASLDADDSGWAAKELATLRQLAEAAKLDDFAENMALEYRIACRTMMLPDFAEGVRAVLVDKDNAPQWSPPTPEEVSEDLLDSIFAPLPADLEWKPLPHQPSA